MHRHRQLPRIGPRRAPGHRSLKVRCQVWRALSLPLKASGNRSLLCNLKGVLSGPRMLTLGGKCSRSRSGMRVGTCTSKSSTRRRLNRLCLMVTLNRQVLLSLCPCLLGLMSLTGEEKRTDRVIPHLQKTTAATTPLRETVAEAPRKADKWPNRPVEDTADRPRMLQRIIMATTATMVTMVIMVIMAIMAIMAMGLNQTIISKALKRDNITIIYMVLTLTYTYHITTDSLF
mmetsp:Transcript_69903/g.120979  ORF Transcript_69903/g.120979 Transcript_69903/m.120979 type:complete len:231 (-) Transcript_69903:2427-3119(-)